MSKEKVLHAIEILLIACIEYDKFVTRPSVGIAMIHHTNEGINHEDLQLIADKHKVRLCKTITKNGFDFVRKRGGYEYLTVFTE